MEMIHRGNFMPTFMHTLNVASEPIIPDYSHVMEISYIIDLLLLLAAAFYLIVHIGLIAGLRRLDYSIFNDRPFVSIIVAARNEEKNICQLLHSLSHQTYSRYEIIIVNDRSADRTAQLVADFRKNYSNITLIEIKSLLDNMPAKKNALRAGINASKGEILCFTDADCFPPPHWIEELVKTFQPDVGLVAGYSPYQIPNQKFSTSGLFDKIFFDFIAYEEFRAAIWSSGAIGWNLGWLCTGRNLAYRRKVYDEVGGFEKIKQSISGDDDLFLQLVRRQTVWKINYVKTLESFVPTVPPNTFWSFVEQRKRHFSAAKFFTLPMMLFFFIYHSSNLLLLVSPLLFLINVLTLPVMAAVCCSKLLGDFVLFKYSSRIFEPSHFHRSFILMEALYILYNSLIGPLGFFRKFAWKQT
jgi:cellulose synthase/poly-beta-1,6-N-acetylglucosamine synthase-like glycosyltransferase